MKFYNVPSKKIEVIYLANSFSGRNLNKSIKTDFPKNYVLFIGDRWHYKNFEGFAKAMKPLFKNDKDLFAICGGGRPFSKQEKKFLSDLGIEDKVLHKKVTDDIIVALYKNARAFVFPSKYEGFGIPVLEAYSCGCPLIVSDRGSLPEVAGKACVYFNPDNISSITKSIKKVIYDEKLRQTLITKGFKQAEKFSWEKTALATKKVYESIL